MNNKLKQDTNVNNRFKKGPESWCSYDYHGSVVSGTNNFLLATHENKGGINDSGYIWVDQTRWSADTPERPISILPLIFYALIRKRPWTSPNRGSVATAPGMFPTE